MKVFGPGMIKPGKRIIFAIKISLIWTLTLHEVFTGKESTHTNAHTNKHTHTPHTYKYTTVTKVVYIVKLKRVVFLQWLPQGSEDNQWHTVTALVNIKHCFINRTISKICSKITIITPKWRHWRRSDVFSTNFYWIFCT